MAKETGKGTGSAQGAGNLASDINVNVTATLKKKQGQNTIEDRVNTLEQRVTELENQVSGLLSARGTAGNKGSK